MRKKLSDEVLTETQNRYNRPENYYWRISTKVNHLISDKLKPDTRSNDINLQRVQSNLAKGIISVVSVSQNLVNARDKISKNALDVRAATDAIALIGTANFKLYMRRRDNIKPELNEDYKHLCFSSVPFTDILFGNDCNLSRQLRDLAEATKDSWYPKLLRLLVAPPLLISHRDTALLTLQGCQKLHLLRKKLNVFPCHLCRDYQNGSFSEKAANIVLQSWCQSSQKQYDVHIKNWLFVRTEGRADPIFPSIYMAVEFQTILYEKGFSYTSINSARCALSAILETHGSAHPTFGEHPDVKGFRKALSKAHPHFLVITKLGMSTWFLSTDIGSMDDSQDLSLKDLTLKLVMLVALTVSL